ncbi:MAG TPA: Gfo/Idh/MocA family oxidoreductase [Streptosporangiaceae bacterium]
MDSKNQEILLVGAGTAGRTHLRVLEDIPALTVVGVVDPNVRDIVTFRSEELPLHNTIRDAGGLCDPDVVVIATPTSTHSRLCHEAKVRLPGAAILVEKPAADNWLDAERLLMGNGGGQPVNVALHMAFAPEVMWGAELSVAMAPDLGDPVAIESWSADPYQANLDSAKARLSNSWVDSGINALSVIERFARVADRISARALRDNSWSAFEGKFRCEADGSQVQATVVTSWRVTDPTRSTRIRYSSGAELLLDHHAVAGYLILKGAVSDLFGSDGVIPRRDTHYRALYKSWLVEGRPMFPDGTILRLHDLLLRPFGNS